MKKLCLLYVVAISLSSFTIVGCGSGAGTETKVVTDLPVESAPMDVDPKAYEAAMKGKK